MTNTKRSLSFILGIAQIAICIVLIVIISHDIGFPSTQQGGSWIPFISDHPTEFSVVLGILGVSLFISTLSLVFTIKWDNANALLGWGIASIFLLNIGAGIGMILGSHQIKFEIDGRKELGIVFSTIQMLVSLLVIASITYNLVEPIAIPHQKLIIFASIGAYFFLSFVFTLTTLILIVQNKRPKAMLALGVISIFFLNIGAGITSIVKAPDTQIRLKVKTRKAGR